MQVEIDMSGRIEETTKTTVLAFANGSSFCISISSDAKRQVIQILRENKPKWSETQIHFRFFATLLFLLLKDHLKSLELVLIDPEYTGYERDIKEWVMMLFRKEEVTIYQDQLGFQHVGKKSPAHHRAIDVFRGKQPADGEIGVEEVLACFGL